jgi:hypothetical protein
VINRSNRERRNTDANEYATCSRLKHSGIKYIRIRQNFDEGILIINKSQDNHILNILNIGRELFHVEGLSNNIILVQYIIEANMSRFMLVNQ